MQKLGGFQQEMHWCEWMNWEKNYYVIFLIKDLSCVIDQEIKYGYQKLHI